MSDLKTGTISQGYLKRMEHLKNNLLMETGEEEDDF